MTIAIDVSPLHDANAVRGVGFYTKRLVYALQTYAPQHEYHLISNPTQLTTLQPDLIHYPYFDPFFLTLPRRQTTPIVVTVHDCIMLAFPQYFPKGIKGWLKLQLQTWNLQHTDAVITDSHNSKIEIQKYYRIQQSQIHVAHLAVEDYFQTVEDPAIQESAKNKYHLPDQFLIKVGDINLTKNFSVTLQALSQVPDAHLVLVGKALIADQENQPIIPELQSIIDQIQQLKLQDRVHRIGFVPDADMPVLYTLARATLQNSLYEGFGLPALESLACATPVISANTSSLPEIVGEGTGLLVDPTSIEQTAHAIQEILAMPPAEYRQLSQNALTQSKNFSLEKLAHDTVRVYESIHNMPINNTQQIKS